MSTDNVKCDRPEIAEAREDGRRRGYRAGIMDALWYLEHLEEQASALSNGVGETIGKLLARADEVDPRAASPEPKGEGG